MGSYTKDLSAINPDLSSVFILDNSPVAYRMFPGKLILLKYSLKFTINNCIARHLFVIPFL